MPRAQGMSWRQEEEEGLTAEELYQICRPQASAQNRMGYIFSLLMHLAVLSFRAQAQV